MITRVAGLLLLFLCTASGPVRALEIHSQHCPYGCPQGVSKENDLIIRDIYLLSSNDRTKFADWVAYTVSPDTIGHSGERQWRKDPLLSAAETLEPADYRGAFAALGTDRGHLVPRAAVGGTGLALQTDYMSNIAPQKSSLNQGPWEQLETAVRTLADSGLTLRVMAGTLYESPQPSLPGADEDHQIPSGFWKVVVMERNPVPVVNAFLMNQNAGRRDDFCSYRIPVSTLEKRSGLRFFHLFYGKSKNLPVDETATFLCH